jgi:hypothetical protein
LRGEHGLRATGGARVPVGHCGESYTAVVCTVKPRYQ